MANKIAVVYQHVKINNKWTFKKAPAIRQGKSGYGLAARTVEAYQYRLGYPMNRLLELEATNVDELPGGDNLDRRQ